MKEEKEEEGGEKRKVKYVGEFYERFFFFWR